MNEQTTRLLEQLAEKLGTTTEYLWGVLLKQAPISAATDLLLLFLIILLGVVLINLHKYFSTETGQYKESIYEKEDWLFLPMSVMTIIWVIAFLIFFFSIGNIINGFFNPEYWALKKVLNSF